MATWPLAAGLGRDVPGDLGDSLLNMWILAWGAEHVPSLLTGAMSWQQFWDANIFHPSPLALSLSEHLFGQVLQILPLYWITGNIILCYNLLFLSTFVLSAFGTYLLVRDLTGDRRAAFIAGLVYGFLPYRIASVPHLQVLSSQWMPFALYGLNRFVTRGSRRALAGGTFALVMQNWSCGYYLLYFAPFAPLFVVHRMWALGPPTLAHTAPASYGEVSPKRPPAAKADTVRTWAYLGAAAVVTLILTLPFLLPYTKAQQLFGFERPFAEVVQYSANVRSYATASENLWLFGKALRYYPHGEGETFLGFVPWILALIAIVGLLRPGPAPEKRQTPLRRALIILLWVAVVTQFIGVVSAVIFGGFDLDLLGLTIRARTPQRPLLQFLAAAVLLLVASPRARATAARAARSPLVFFAVATVLAMWLSLGPLPNAGEVHVSGFGLYRVLYDYIPGFKGVRVPARYAMLAGLFLAVMAGYGMATLLRLTAYTVRLKPDATTANAYTVRLKPDATTANAYTVRLKPDATTANVASGFSRTSVATLIVACLVLLEGAAIPLEMNRTWAQNEAMPPARVYPTGSLGRRLVHRSLGEGGSLGEGVPPVYARLAALPAGSAITEFPFGDAAWEIRYVYYAAAHWKPITNGYSGNFPPAYKALVARLQRVSADPEASWKALTDSGTTHVVLHAKAFANPADAETVRVWLETHGARLVETFADNDALYELR